MTELEKMDVKLTSSDLNDDERRRVELFLEYQLSRLALKMGWTGKVYARVTIAK